MSAQNQNSELHSIEKLVVAISSRALFNLDESLILKTFG